MDEAGWFALVFAMASGMVMAMSWVTALRSHDPGTAVQPLERTE